ncbi:alpha/beta fold hydrolase [Nakamurella sp. GG22]
MGEEIMVRVGDVELCVQTFGDASDPAILLIGGMNASMDWWEDDFCRRLAAGGRFVIRYDHRDTGRSTSYPAGSPGYSGPDLIADAVGVLDALGRDAAHVVGISMGGALAQVLTLEHPDRVLTLTVISSSAGPGDPDLPGMDEALAREFAALPAEPDWSDRQRAIDHIVESCRPLAAVSVPFDAAAIRAVAEKAFDRTTDVAASQTNHALVEGGETWRGRLGEITVPTLIIHGEEDRMFPVGHGVALADEIGGARLLVLPATGHELPQRVWDLVVPAIVRLTSPNWQTRADVLAERFIARDDPTGWFDRLYGAANRGLVSMPWDREAPQPLLAEWLDRAAGDADGRRAIVVGCGLGADPEYLSRLGFRTTAFDVSPTAISIARDRHPGSSVAYSVQDLFDLPAEWSAAFDLVVEIYTVQALPLSLRERATAAVAGLVAPGGTLLVIQAVRDDSDTDPEGPPWPLTRAEIERFGAAGLTPVQVERLVDDDGSARWRAEFTRP